jgi:hypothetical protein
MNVCLCAYKWCRLATFHLHVLITVPGATPWLDTYDYQIAVSCPFLHISLLVYKEMFLVSLCSSFSLTETIPEFSLFHSVQRPIQWILYLERGERG